MKQQQREGRMFHEVAAADGHRFEVWIEEPASAARGAVVVLQEIFGVTGQLRRVARHYADLGYRVAVPALFDRQRRGAVLDFGAIGEARALMEGASAEAALEDIRATVAYLGGKVAVIGFCWGGGLAVAAAQRLDLACAVSFYGTRLERWLGAPLGCPVQGHFGARDDHTPAAVLERVRAEWPGLEMHLYEAGHAFANDERPAHVPAAADLAQARTAAFLAAHLG